MSRHDAQQALRSQLASERGTLRNSAATRIALVYPSPYRAAMASLGYQQIYRLLNAVPGLAADRAVLPDDAAAARAAGCPVVLVTYGYNHGEPVRGVVDADGYLDSLAELGDWLAR